MPYNSQTKAFKPHSVIFGRICGPAGFEKGVRTNREKVHVVLLKVGQSPV